MKVILRGLVSFSLTVLTSGTAFAGRPLQTDDAGVLDRGACEIESAALQRRAAGSHDHETSVQLSCGLGWSQQLGIAAAVTASQAEQQTGLSIGGKGELWSGGDGAPAISLGWQLSEARTPAGSWHHVGTGLNLIASAPMSVTDTLHANVGHSRDENARSDSSTWGIGIEHAGPGWAWVPMAEVFGDDRQRPWANVGVRLEALPERLFVAASMGRQLSALGVNLLTVSFRLAL